MKPTLTMTQTRNGMTINTHTQLDGPIEGMSQEASDAVVRSVVSSLRMMFIPGNQDADALLAKTKMRLPLIEGLLLLVNIKDEDTFDLLIR